MRTPSFHFELFAPAPRTAARAVNTLFGWQSRNERGEGHLIASTLASVGITRDRKKEPARWVAYVEVEDVEKALKHVLELGARVVVPEHPISVGKKAVLLEDPSGCRFGLVASRATGPTIDLDDEEDMYGLNDL